MSSEFQWVFKKLARDKNLLLKDKHKTSIKLILLILILACAVYIFVVSPTFLNIIFIVLILCGAPHLVDLIFFIKKQLHLNEMRYLDLKNSLEIITKHMTYSKGACFNGGMWSSNEIKDELRIGNNERYQNCKNRDLSGIEKHLWMLYIKTDNFIFCEMLTHLLQGKKIHLAFFPLKSAQVIIMHAHDEKTTDPIYAAMHDSGAPVFLMEPNVFDFTIDDELSHHGKIKEYVFNDNKFLFWSGLTDEIRNAVTYDLVEESSIDKEKRKHNSMHNFMGHTGYQPYDVVYEICNGETRELELETEKLRQEINNFLKLNKL